MGEERIEFKFVFGRGIEISVRWERDSPSCPRSTARMKSSVRSIVVRWSTIVDPVPPLSPVQDILVPIIPRYFPIDRIPPSSSASIAAAPIYAQYAPASIVFASSIDDRAADFSSDRFDSYSTFFTSRSLFLFSLSLVSNTRPSFLLPPPPKTILSNRPTTNKLSDKGGSEGKDGYGVYFSGTTSSRV